MAGTPLESPPVGCRYGLFTGVHEGGQLVHVLGSDGHAGHQLLLGLGQGAVLDEGVGLLNGQLGDGSDLLKSELERARLDNGELEEKLARMGRSLAAARRARYTSTADKS